MNLATIGIAAGSALFAAAIGGAIWLLPETILPARFAATDCRRVQITTPDGPLSGAEDIAVSGDGRLLYISAYDRLAVEEALELELQPPEGGLYVVPVGDLDRIGEVTAIRAIEQVRVPGGLRPHGIHASGNRVMIVNRGYDRTRLAETTLILLRPVPDTTDGSLEIAETLTNSGFCAANDVVLTTGVAYASLDRGTCPGWSSDELVGLSFKGRLIRVPLGEGGRGAQAVLAGLAFPNGVAVVQAGAFRGAVVAETRRSRLIFAEADDLVEIPLPGGPDNISVDEEGLIIAAVHPSLAKLGLYRYGYAGAAPSRIIRINPLNGEIEVLFDDPGGSLFSAASSAVMAGRTLVAGSVRDDGLLICRFGLG